MTKAHKLISATKSCYIPYYYYKMVPWCCLRDLPYFFAIYWASNVVVNEGLATRKGLEYHWMLTCNHNHLDHCMQELQNSDLHIVSCKILKQKPNLAQSYSVCKRSFSTRFCFYLKAQMHSRGQLWKDYHWRYKATWSVGCVLNCFIV